MEPPDRFDLEVLPKMIRRDMGFQIRLAREELGISQADLAFALGRRQAYISELETGKTEPSASMLVRLSRILKKPVIYFFPEDWRDRSGREEVTEGKLTVEELELVRTIREIEPSFRHYHLAIYLARALAQYDMMVDELIDEKYREP